ncbi:MAG: threonine ammonia-lyase, biosynthetic [Deltaproteobacteria bacterium]|nr:MAG: threonine ammonia-lyase, biosynthetic [Deltaproteobacteria bacterium]
MHSLFKKILTSSVYEAAVETSLDRAEILSERFGNHILLKREDQQPVFSFKLRGAYNKIANLAKEDKKKGVIAASAGNHAQGVAYAATKLGISAVIVMPVTTPRIKIEAVKKFGGEVVLAGENYSEAADHAFALQKESGRVFIHPFDDELVIAGQGTVADELLRQNPGRLDAVFVPVGGGGLAAGIAVYIKTLRPEIKVLGVEPLDSDAMYQSLAKGRRISLDSVGIFADGVAVRQVGSLTYEICHEYLDGVIRVSTDEICGGIKAVYKSTRSVVEPAGGLAMAGLLQYIRNNKCKGETLVAVNSGANMNFERLRYVAERTLVGEQQEALFAVTIPEQAGSLKRFCHELVGGRNITEFNYRLRTREEAHIFVGISINSIKERQAFGRSLQKAGYRSQDLTDNSLAKTHIRYMVGGHSEQVKNERLFRFWFPETPGALTRFLDAIQVNCNISLFHYRAQGGDFGRVLIGLELEKGSDQELHDRLDKLGYRYHEETDNPVYGLFL